MSGGGGGTEATGGGGSPGGGTFDDIPAEEVEVIPTDEGGRPIDDGGSPMDVGGIVGREGKPDDVKPDTDGG